MATPERIDERIQELQTRIEQQKNLLDKLKARKAETARKADTRRKILAGAVALKHVQKDPTFAAQFTAWLNAELTAPRDRVLFQLSAQPPKPANDAGAANMPDNAQEA